MRRDRQITVGLAGMAAATTTAALPTIEWSVITLISIVLLGLGSVAVWQGYRVAAYLACSGVLGLAWIACLGYLYGADSGDQAGNLTPMTLPSAVALVFLALTVMALIPDGLIQWVLTGDDAGAMLQRRILPVAILVLPALGFLRLFLERNGRSTDTFALAANITVASIAMVAITVQSARRLRVLDADRSQAEEALRTLNQDLAQRIKERSEELERERTRVALLRDRDRIARDLHDRVIQRLFASGLQLTSLQAALDDRVAKRVDGVVNDLDSVIRELRKTIFALETSVVDDPAAALSATVRRVGRILGFEPELSVEGDVSRLTPTLSGHVLAVAHEALSNVIRHAEAANISVVLNVDKERVVLAVEDDGVGLPKHLAHRSGLANIESRARELGGKLSWGQAVPKGTLLVFEAPLLTPVARVS